MRAVPKAAAICRNVLKVATASGTISLGSNDSACVCRGINIVTNPNCRIVWKRVIMRTELRAPIAAWPIVPMISIMRPVPTRILIG